MHIYYSFFSFAYLISGALMFNLLREISNLLPTHVCKLERQKILETLNMINVNITPPSAGTSNNVSKLSRTKMQHAEMH